MAYLIQHCGQRNLKLTGAIFGRIQQNAQQHGSLHRRRRIIIGRRRKSRQRRPRSLGVFGLIKVIFGGHAKLRASGSAAGSAPDIVWEASNGRHAFSGSDGQGRERMAVQERGRGRRDERLDAVMEVRRWRWRGQHRRQDGRDVWELHGVTNWDLMMIL